jgi:hypothetical protein
MGVPSEDPSLSSFWGQLHWGRVQQPALEAMGFSQPFGPLAWVRTRLYFRSLLSLPLGL